MASDTGWVRVSLYYRWETDPIFIKSRLDEGQCPLHMRNWSNFHQIQAGWGSVSTTHEKLIQFSSNPGWMRVSVHYTWETDPIFIKSRLDEGQCPLHMRNWSNFHQVQAGWRSVSTTHEKLIQFSSNPGWIRVFILHVRNWSNSQTVWSWKLQSLHLHYYYCMIACLSRINPILPVVEFIQIQDYWEQVF